MRRWIVEAVEAGERLDKFLAGRDRLESRARAASAIERGRIFLNDREATIAVAARRLSAGDVFRLWADRPGSAKKKPVVGPDRDLPIAYEDATLGVLSNPAGVLATPVH